ncbi:family A G protein-coupled receptor-like protein [Calocera viscosa TUFC12733]|uniref:Family A G protein-coupled receptor-like protein n=1 Tax=Calocera viscosa (strain TUFC12733) TaxID=1330018 RepID=A0A167J115_CALVF|nr:family A G protein-coupled receptor-like protein [Calocera viscosa TUFC12733]
MSDWLWAVFTIILLWNVVISVWARILPCGQRVFHLLPIIILTTAAVAYLSMAADLGGTSVQAESSDTRHQNEGVTRAVGTRIPVWVITTPLLPMKLLLRTGLPVSDIFVTVFMDIAMIVARLWCYFAGGMAALFFIWYILLTPARASAELIGPDVRSIYLRPATFLSFLWLLYPMAWGVSDGGNVIHPDSEMVFNGILDILAKPVFIFIHIASLRGVDMSRFGLTGVGVGGISAIQGYQDGRVL